MARKQAVETATNQERTNQERSFHADVSWMLAARVVALACGVGTTVVVARALGPTGRGEVAVAVNLTLLLVQFGGLGFQSANVYFVAQERDARKRIVWNSAWLALVAGAGMATVGAALKAIAPDAVTGLDWLELGIALAAIPAVLAAQFLQSVLLADRRIVAYNVTEVVFALLTLVALAIGLFAFDLGVLGALCLIVGGRFLAALTFLALALRSGERMSAPDLELGRRMLAYGARAYLAALLAFLVIRIDLLLVNGYLGPAEAGLYSVAVALADGMLLLPQVVSLNLFSRVAHGLETDRSAKVFRILFVLFGVLCLVSVPLAAPVIEFLYGEAFSGAAELYYWLVVGVFSLGMLNVLAQHFAGRGFPLEAALVWFIGVGLNLGINVAFLDSKGTYIASLASSVAYLVLLALHVRMFARDAGYASLVPRLRDLLELLAFRRSAMQERIG